MAPLASGLRRLLSPQPDPAPARAYGWTRGFLGALLSVAAAMLVGYLIAGIPPLQSIALIYVPAIVYAALKFGFVSALFASVLSVVAYNFQFMEPFGAFGLRGLDDVLAVVVFLAVGALTSDLANQIRRQAVAAREREAHSAALYDLKRVIDRADSPEALGRAVVAEIGRRFAAPAALWEAAGRGEWRLLAGGEGAAAAPPPAAVAAPGGETTGPAATRYLPMASGDGVIGMLSVPVAGISGAPGLALLRAFAGEAGDALRHLRVRQELEAARRVAETERLRGALLNSITHDFRTPLASILGATTTLMVPGPAFSEEARTTLLTTIRDEALRLDRFIRNLLDMSRLEAGTVVPNLDWVDVVDVVGAAAQHVRRTRADVALVIALPEALPMLRLDAVLIEHALVNILDNAMRHSPPQGRVTLAARLAGPSLVLEIDDQGPGVPVAERERIFEKHARARSGDRGRAGTGLGLSIARGFVDAQGGNVHVTEAPGGGARFEVNLPVPAPPGPRMERAAG